MTAKKRYDELSGERSQFLNVAEQAADLTLPYLIRGEEQSTAGMRHLPTPWQSVGAKGVVTLSAKLMLALLPPQTSFFKLQVDESMLGQFAPEVKSEIDLSFSKIERVILDAIAASDDRVGVHQAIKHLVVAGNALLFMSKKGLKLYPLNRYVCERDGNGNVVEIVTKELINKDILEEVFPGYKPTKPEGVSDSTVGIGEDVEVYTHIKRVDKKFNWHQEIDGKIIPRTKGTSPLETNPWIPLRFNVVDGEAYGRGRVEEFLVTSRVLRLCLRLSAKVLLLPRLSLLYLLPVQLSQLLWQLLVTVQLYKDGLMIFVVQVGKTADLLLLTS